MSATEKKLLHYTGKAISDFNMIQRGDRIMVCLSGGKDSFTLLTLLHSLQKRAVVKFELRAFTLDQAQPGWDDQELKNWLTAKEINYEILRKDTYSIVKEKVPKDKTYCSLCSRLRRGIIYRYAEENGFNKIALGHHREDLITSLMMSILFNGELRSMPPKLLSDNREHIIIRPLCYVQEKDIISFAMEQNFPIIPCNLCGSQENLLRPRIAKLIADLATENPKVPSNILHALQSIKPSQLMDQRCWNFRNLEKLCERGGKLANVTRQHKLNPFEILQILWKGNKRFFNDNCRQRYSNKDLKYTAENQYPMAVVLGCIDSRVPVEIIFDMSFGDLFCIRVAGNVINEDILASIEYSCNIMGAKLIVVLGHTRCGAVQAACDGIARGHITRLLSKIKPAIDAETQTTTSRNSGNQAFIKNVIEFNIANTLQQIYKKSAILKQMIEQEEIMIIGAIYDVATGKVHFNDYSPQLAIINKRKSDLLLLQEKLQKIAQTVLDSAESSPSG